MLLFGLFHFLSHSRITLFLLSGIFASKADFICWSTLGEFGSIAPFVEHGVDHILNSHEKNVEHGALYQA